MSMTITFLARPTRCPLLPQSPSNFEQFVLLARLGYLDSPSIIVVRAARILLIVDDWYSSLRWGLALAAANAT
jgi:hypothetical protein